MICFHFHLSLYKTRQSLKTNYLKMKKYVWSLFCLILILAPCCSLVFPFCNGRPSRLKPAMLSLNLTTLIYFQLDFKTCYFFRNEGHGFGRDCLRNLNLNMWYYDLWSNDCKRMTYWGCGGNINRHCTYQECKERCRWFLRN